MHRTARKSTLAATVLGLTTLLLQCGPLASAQGTSPQAVSPFAPVFVSRNVVMSTVNAPFLFTVRTAAHPVATTITETGALPVGVTFVNHGNGTATLSGSEPLSGTYTFDLAASNGISPNAAQTLTLIVASKLPPIRHVFVIMLENNDYSATFGNPSTAPFLATLPSRGALLANYYGIGHFSNDNYIGFISGQPPNSVNQSDCAGNNYVDFTMGQDANGIQQGTGCVYPTAVETLADQLSAEGLSWKGYMEDMGNDPARESANCGHPAVGTADPSFVAEAVDGYATRHDPFVYFHSIIDNTASCTQNVVPLGAPSGELPAGVAPGTTGLATDLASVATTPNFSFISPNLCDDGHDYPCTNTTGAGQGGGSSAADIDKWLTTWVPMITSSPAFKQDGLLEITSDEAEQPILDSTACCGETPGPAASAGGNGLTGPGGGRVGAVLLSPFITPGTVVPTSMAYNHYSSLASIEDLFGLPRLGEAKTVTTTFDRYVYDTRGTVPAVTVEPDSQTVASGQTVTVTAAASGLPSPTVQWQFATALSSEWSDIPGATSTTFTSGTVTAFENGWQLRAVFTNALGAATTEAAVLTVDS